MAMGFLDNTVTQGDLKMVFANQLEYVIAVFDLVLFNARSEICSYTIENPAAWGLAS